MKKGGKTMMGIPTETADLSQLELTDSGLRVVEPAQDQTKPSECRAQLLWLGQSVGPLAVGPGFMPSA